MTCRRRAFAAIDCGELDRRRCQHAQAVANRLALNRNCGRVARRGVRGLSFALIVERRISSFVHPDIMDRPAERLRHQIFILRRLASSLAMLCLVPPVSGRLMVLPPHGRRVVFVLFLLPVGAVALVSRTGHLVLAQAICVASFVGAALTIATAGGPWQAALICLAFAPFEGVFSQNRRLVLAGGLLRRGGGGGPRACRAHRSHRTRLCRAAIHRPVHSCCHRLCDHARLWHRRLSRTG